MGFGSTIEPREEVARAGREIDIPFVEGDKLLSRNHYSASYDAWMGIITQ